VPGTKRRVSLKYCGSCNPLIDLPKIGQALPAAISQETDLLFVSADETNIVTNIDTIIILCGCPRACGNKEAIRVRASNCIVVAGESVDAVPVAEKDISTAIIKKLKPK